MEKPAPQRWTLCTALLALGMVLGVYGLLGMWPFGQGTMVTGDLNEALAEFHITRIELENAAGWSQEGTAR